MTEAFRSPTQQCGSQLVSLLEAAHRLNVSVVGSATLMQSQLARALPTELHLAFPGFSTDARRAIAFAQSLPLASALVGMKSRTPPRGESRATTGQLETQWVLFPRITALAGAFRIHGIQARRTVFSTF